MRQQHKDQATENVELLRLIGQSKVSISRLRKIHEELSVGLKRGNPFGLDRATLEKIWTAVHDIDSTIKATENYIALLEGK
jgi:hypothetical protein